MIELSDLTVNIPNLLKQCNHTLSKTTHGVGAGVPPAAGVPGAGLSVQCNGMFLFSVFPDFGARSPSDPI